jgi:hypothetical protein
VFHQVLHHLETELIKNDEETKVSYAFLGITDSKCVNLNTEKPIHSIPDDGIDELMVKSKSVQEIRDKLARGSSLPYLLCLRIEYAATHLPTGYMLLADLGTPSFAPGVATGLMPNLTKSVDSLRDVMYMLAKPEKTGPLPHMDNKLCAFLTSFVGGTAMTKFVFDVETCDKLSLLEADRALSFAETCRQVRSRPTSNFVDTRLLQLLSFHTHLKEEFVQLQQRFADVTLDMEEKERDHAHFKKETEQQMEQAANMIVDLKANVGQLELSAREHQGTLAADHQKTVEQLYEAQDKLSHLQRSSRLRESELEHNIHHLKTEQARLHEEIRRVTATKSKFIFQGF